MKKYQIPLEENDLIGYETTYALIDYGDGPRCGWCKKKNPSNKHLEKHDKHD